MRLAIQLQKLSLAQVSGWLVCRKALPYVLKLAPDGHTILITQPFHNLYQVSIRQVRALRLLLLFYHATLVILRSVLFVRLVRTRLFDVALFALEVDL